MTDVYLNEKFVGEINEPKEFITKVINARRENLLPNITNVHHNEELNEIHIDLTKGRIRRPLIIVKNGKSLLTKEHIEKLTKNEATWNDLLKESVIEYLDANEEEISYIAINEDELTEKHTHLEISPITYLGLTTSLIPFSNYGSSSRLIRGSKLQKQALGLYASNFLSRVDTDVSVLHYPQRPIVKTFMHDVINYDNYSILL